MTFSPSIAEGKVEFSGVSFQSFRKVVIATKLLSDTAAEKVGPIARIVAFGASLPQQGDAYGTVRAKSASFRTRIETLDPVDMDLSIDASVRGNATTIETKFDFTTVHRSFLRLVDRAVVELETSTGLRRRRADGAS